MKSNKVTMDDANPPCLETGETNLQIVETADPVIPKLTKEEIEQVYKRTFGTSDRDLAYHLMRQLSAVMPNRLEGDVDQTLKLVMTLQSAIRPKDELESMLAAQMASVHNLAMDCLGRANIKGLSIAGVAQNIEWANKLMRTFTTQIETLNRHRGKGQQKVTVEHVTVNNGGQAMIGLVERRGEGGGDVQK